MLICLSGLPEAYCFGVSLGIVATARQRPLRWTFVCVLQTLIYLSWSNAFPSLPLLQLVPPPNASDYPIKHLGMFSHFSFFSLTSRLRYPYRLLCTSSSNSTSY
jgi:hypothetical protein